MKLKIFYAAKQVSIHRDMWAPTVLELAELIRENLL